MTQRLKILMLEDNKDDIFLIKRILERSGMQFDVTLAMDKKEFSEAISKASFDIVLSDHQLEEFDCIEALKMCREKRLNVPFVLVSGMITDKTALTVQEKGVKAYVLKKDINKLPAIIQEIIN